ncbi:sushi domain-containing protein 3 isoform X2 [Pseudorasbora parva]|uniref:sushi domain-containing protein 3 isoform X2 n=1 Tax=Pseudorasbora parva TaxID=51549 RepID=UPI00351F0123
MGDWSSVRNRTGQCAPLQSPVIGTLKLVSGDGSSVGSVMSLQCPSRHRPVGGAQMACVDGVWSSDDAHWSGGTPECKPLSRLEDPGFRLALLMSFISVTIILLMSIAFITSCLVKHVKREERRRARKSGASKFWHQMDVELEELQKTTNNNNNNNNNNYTQHTADRQIYSCGDLRSPCRCLHQEKPYPQIIHPAQISLILSPATDHLMNTHTSAVDAHTGSGHTHFCRPLQDPVWTGQHRFNPPVHII